MSQSVCAVLQEEFGIVGSPGRKTTCPFCKQEKLSIHRDDSIAKCFEPSCGRFVTPNSPGANPLPGILFQMTEDFHAALVAAPNQDAYAWLIERKIHPFVISAARLGVVPGGYDPEPLFERHLERLSKQAEAEAAAPKPPEGTKSKPTSPKKGATAAERLEELRSALATLKKHCSTAAGWLVFGYEGADRRLTGLKFRKPRERYFITYKPGPQMGVFLPVGLAGKGEGFTERHSLVVTEGEFNSLAIQSALVGVYGAEEKTLSYVCSVGGVNTADAATLKALSRKPVVFYDNDADGAGLQLVLKLQEKLTLSMTTTKTAKDFAGVLALATPDVAVLEFKQCLDESVTRYRSRDGVRLEADELRRSISGQPGGMKKFESYRSIAELVLGDLTDRGKLYNTVGGQGYVFLEEDKTLISIERDSTEWLLLMDSYGVAPSEDLFQFLVDDLRIHAVSEGTQTVVHPFSYYCAARDTLYVYSNGTQVYRITADSIESVDNGTDGVLFLRNRAWEEFRYLPEYTGKSLFQEKILDAMNFVPGQLSSAERRVVFAFWFYAQFFPQLFPTRPIIAMIGEAGSGKTFALRKVGMLLFGRNFDVSQLPSDPKDLDAAITHDPLVCIDNADSAVDWLEDKLAMAATGGVIKRRQLHTTNFLVEFPITAFMGITSRTPYFKREDVADRLLIFRMERLSGGFRPESEMIADLMEHRDRMMTEVLRWLQYQVQSLRLQKGVDYASNFRMADFANFCLKVTCQKPGGQDYTRGLFDKLIQEQALLAMEGDPLLDLLTYWVRQKSPVVNAGRWIPAEELLGELADIANFRRIEFHLAGKTRAFAQKLKIQKNVLKKFFELQEREGRSRKTWYSFRTLEDEAVAQDLIGDMPSYSQPLSVGLQS